MDGRLHLTLLALTLEMVVWFSPPDPPDSVVAARDALADRSRRAGLAWLDVSPPAAAAPRAPEHLRRGLEAYDGLRFDEALAAFDAAAEEIAATGADGLSPAELSDVFLYRGLTYTQRGDSARAWDDLVRAAVVNPARTLDPLRFPPRAVEAFQRARDQVAAQARATLTLSAPAGCAVRVDAAPAASAAITVAPGDHYVRVVCAGHAPWGARVTVDGAGAHVTPALQRVAPPPMLERARARGARGVILATVSLDADVPATLTLEKVDAQTGKVSDRTTVALPPGGAATPDAVAAFERLLAGPVEPPPPPPRPRRFYQKPWVWGLAGAAVATAIILPFALSGGGDGPSAVDADFGKPPSW
jgi:hypothetical protein